MQLVKKIDIHVHTSESAWFSRLPNERFATPSELIGMYDRLGIEKGVLLPSINIESDYQTSSNYENYLITQQYPDRFYWFCNVDPRQGGNADDTDYTPFLNDCKSHGAKGVGEICANLYFDDPMTMNLFRCCEACDMPVIFHIGNMGRDYGLVDEMGLPRLEKALAAFPKLKFLGHSQKFWAEIGGDLTAEERCGYPTGKVVPGGRLIELFETYPNLFGDLSAGSGYNAMARDPDFGYAFMERYQDRLFFGTDICSPKNLSDARVCLAAFLDDGVLSGRLSEEAYLKISRGNALKLLERQTICVSDSEFSERG